jgi:hypothetical protein
MFILAKSNTIVRGLDFTSVSLEAHDMEAIISNNNLEFLSLNACYMKEELHPWKNKLQPSLTKVVLYTWNNYFVSGLDKLLIAAPNIKKLEIASAITNYSGSKFQRFQDCSEIC